MENFRSKRCIELSSVYYLEQCFASDWSDITVVKSFSDAYAKDIKLPVVCVRLSESTPHRRELGSTTVDSTYMIVVDVFAESTAQRNDLSDYIIDKLKDGWVYYTHARESGTTRGIVRTADGRIQVTEFINDMPVDLGDTTDQKDRFRHIVTVVVRKSS
jgi:hypothetical protein